MTLRPLFRWWTPPRKLALFGVLGALLVAVPAWQVWRHFGLELSAAQSARAALEPLAHATATQRALLAHRPSAAQVARGELAQEPTRRLRQRDVDQHLGALGAALQRARFYRAEDEAAAMTADWSGLVDRLAAHRIDAAASDHAHDLLVEQTVLVVDLISMAVSLERGSDADDEPARQAFTAALQLHAALGRLDSALASGEAPRIEAARRLLVTREGVVLAPLARTIDSARDPALAAAYAAARRTLGVSDLDAPAATEAARIALVSLGFQAERAWDESLVQRIEGAALARAALACTYAMLLLALAILLWPRRAQHGSNGPNGTNGPDSPHERQEPGSPATASSLFGPEPVRPQVSVAGEVLERLRRSRKHRADAPPR